jgi:hypothetical protein
VMPAVRGKRGGDAVYEVQGLSCHVTLRYQWGDKLAPRRPK